MARVKITWDNRNTRILVEPFGLLVYIRLINQLQSELFMKTAAQLTMKRGKPSEWSTRPSCSKGE